MLRERVGTTSKNSYNIPDAGTLVRKLDCGRYHSQLDFRMDGVCSREEPGGTVYSIQQSCMQEIIDYYLDQNNTHTKKISKYIISLIK